MIFTGTPLVALTQAGLESVAFQNVGCSIHACEAVNELMPTAEALHTFHFFNNMSDNEGAAAIAQVSKACSPCH